MEQEGAELGESISEQSTLPSFDEPIGVEGQESSVTSPQAIEYKVESEDQPAEQVLTEEQVQQYMQEANNYIDSYRRFLTTFAGDSSLNFRLSNAFLIDFERGDIHFDTKWFAERGYSKEQILWAAMHELAHFRDFRNGPPEKMLECFDYMKSQAVTTGKLLQERHEAVTGQPAELPAEEPELKKGDKKPMNRFEQAAYEMHHVFYNCLDDIYVNNLVARRAAKYESDESGGRAVAKLYSEKLFPETDYTKSPRHLQFVYSLLRSEMVPDQELQIGDEVKQALETTIMYNRQGFTAKELINTFLKPRGSQNTQAGRRYAIIRKTLEPIYLELLKKDIEEWEPKDSPPPSGGSGEPGEGQPGQTQPANPFDKEYERFRQANPDQFDPEAVDAWLDQKKQEDEDKPKSKEDQEVKASNAQEKLDRDWCEKNSVEYKDLLDYRQIEERVAPYLDELSRLWRHIIYGQSTGVDRAMEGHFPTGTHMDINQVIADWPKIQKGEFEDVKVMERMVDKETLVKQPELIRVRLLADNSSSMRESNKIETLKETVVLLLSSLHEFETQLNFSRSKTKSNLSVETEVWAYGGSATNIKPLSSKVENDQVAIIKAIGKLDATGWTTKDSAAMEKVDHQLTEEDWQNIQKQKVMEILFNITDGGTMSADVSRRYVDSFTSKGVIARAFQIGQVDRSEKEIFESVWNQNRPESLGFSVGSKVENLIPAVANSLKEFLSGIEI